MHYGPIDPRVARIFIRRALVEGDWDTRAPFFAHNRRLVREIETLEHKSRRPDVLVDDELIYAFYDSAFPRTFNGAGFEVWRRTPSGKPELPLPVARRPHAPRGGGHHDRAFPARRSS